MIGIAFSMFPTNPRFTGSDISPPPGRATHPFIGIVTLIVSPSKLLKSLKIALRGRLARIWKNPDSSVLVIAILINLPSLRDTGALARGWHESWVVQLVMLGLQKRVPERLRSTPTRAEAVGVAKAIRKKRVKGARM